MILIFCLFIRPFFSTYLWSGREGNRFMKETQTHLCPATLSSSSCRMPRCSQVKSTHNLNSKIWDCHGVSSLWDLSIRPQEKVSGRRPNQTEATFHLFIFENHYFMYQTYCVLWSSTFLWNYLILLQKELWTFNLSRVYPASCTMNAGDRHYPRCDPAWKSKYRLLL